MITAATRENGRPEAPAWSLMTGARAPAGSGRPSGDYFTEPAIMPWTK
jgi:hypothetical protein